MRTPLVLLLILLSSPAIAAPVLVEAKPLADVSAIQPGKPFTLGVLLTIKPGWHVYWKNPGETGLPTRVKFDVPAEFTVGEVQFPTPQRIVDPGGIVAFGYEDQVMLTATITPPITLKAGDSVELAATVKWLCCQTDCLPGQGQVKLQLPVADKDTADNVELFKQWRRRLPVRDAAVTVDGPLDLAAKKPSAVINLPSVASAECIPEAVEGIILATESIEGGRKFLLKATRLPGEHVTVKSVDVLITRPDPTGGGRLGMLVTVQIVNGDAATVPAAATGASP